MTRIFNPSAMEREKWRVQAERAATHIKDMPLEQEEYKFGFVYDDATVMVTLTAETICNMTQSELADELFRSVLSATQPGEGAA